MQSVSERALTDYCNLLAAAHCACDGFVESRLRIFRDKFQIKIIPHCLSKRILLSISDFLLQYKDGKMWTEEKKREHRTVVAKCHKLLPFI